MVSSSAPWSTFLAGFPAELTLAAPSWDFFASTSSRHDFLGDSGSLFIGFMLSALALGRAEGADLCRGRHSGGFVRLPILETLFSISRRLISGRPIFTSDREHIHHKLLQMGFSHRQVVIVLYAVSGVFAMLSLFLLWPTGSTLGLVLRWWEPAFGLGFSI